MKLMPRTLFFISAGGIVGSVIGALLRGDSGSAFGLALGGAWFILWIVARGMDWSRPVWDVGDEIEINAFGDTNRRWFAGPPPRKGE